MGRRKKRKRRYESKRGPDGLLSRQRLFVEYYYDRQSPTWSNAYRSMMRAGYSEAYARGKSGAVRFHPAAWKAGNQDDWDREFQRILECRVGNPRYYAYLMEQLQSDPEERERLRYWIGPEYLEKLLSGEV